MRFQLKMHVVLQLSRKFMLVYNMKENIDFRHAYSVETACRSIEQYAFSIRDACRSVERHAKRAENACRSIERHATSAENSCRSMCKTS